MAADTFSRLHRKYGQLDNETKPFTLSVTTSTQLHNTPPTSVEYDDYSMAEDQEKVDYFYSLSEGRYFNNLFMPEESFQSLPNVANNDSPFDFVRIKFEQQHEAELLSTQARHQEIYIKKQVKDVLNLICCVKQGKKH